MWPGFTHRRIINDAGSTERGELETNSRRFASVSKFIENSASNLKFFVVHQFQRHPDKPITLAQVNIFLFFYRLLSLDTGGKLFVNFKHTSDRKPNS